MVTNRPIIRRLLVLTLLSVVGVASPARAAEVGPTGPAQATWASEGLGFSAVLAGNDAVLQNFAVEPSAQRIALSGTPTSGTYTLTLNTQTTAALPFNATPAAVKAALEALANVGPNQVVATQASPTAIDVTFGGGVVDRLWKLRPAATFDAGTVSVLTMATGGFSTQFGTKFLPDLGDQALPTDLWDTVRWQAFDWSVATPNTDKAMLPRALWVAQHHLLAPQAPFSALAQYVYLDAVATAGSFTLTFRGQTTAAIPFNADEAVVKAALEALSSVGSGKVTVDGGPGELVVVLPGDNTVAADQLTASSALTPTSVHAAVLPVFGARANAAAAQLAIWKLLHGTDISPTPNSAVVAQATALVAAANAVAAGSLPGPGDIGFAIDVGFGAGAASGTTDVVVTLSRIAGTDGLRHPFPGQASKLTVDIDGSSLTATPVEAATATATTYTWAIDTPSEGAVAAAGYVGTVAAGARMRPAGTGSVVGQETMLVSDVQLTRWAVTTFSASATTTAPGGTTPTTDGGTALPGAEQLVSGAPDGGGSPTTLPFTGGRVTLPALVAAIGLGALGVWLRRRRHQPA